MRGIPNQNNLVLVMMDGLEINELNSGGFYGGGQYNLANVKRIEVIYGPASALYGTNAVSGIINLITRDPQDEPPGAQIGGGIGGFGTALGNFQFSTFNTESKLGVTLAGMLKSTHYADLSGTNNDNAWTPDLELFEKDRSLDLKVRFHDTVLALNYQNRRSSTATNYPATDTIYRDHGTLWDLRFLNICLKHQITFSRTCSLSSRVYGRETTVLDDSVREITDESQFGFFRPNYRVGMEHTLELHPHRRISLVGGFVLEHDWLADGYGTSQSASPDQRPPRPAHPDMVSSSLFSAYAQGDLHLTANLTLSTGLRLDISSITDTVCTPRLGAVFHRNRLTLKILYGEAFRAPKPWDFTDGRGNDSLAPERMKSAECSVGYQLNERMTWEATVFRYRLHDMLCKQETTNSNGQTEWYWINAGRVDTLGMETGVTVQLGTLRPYLNYTFTRARDQEGKPLPEIAQHNLNFGASYRMGNAVQASLWANLPGGRKSTNPITSLGNTRIAPAFVLNASVSLHTSMGFDFQVVARNCLNSEYYHPSNRAPYRYRQPQCSLQLNAVYTFQ